MSLSHDGRETGVVCDGCQKYVVQRNLVKDLFTFRNWTVSRVYLSTPVWTTTGLQTFYNKHYCPHCTKRKSFKLIKGGLGE